MSTTARRPRRPLRAVLAAGLLCALLPGGGARSAALDPDAAAFLARLEAAWKARDFPGWLGLWDFADAEQQGLEEETVRRSFASDETTLSFLRRPAPAEGATRFDADVQVFEAAEPLASVAYWRLRVEKRAGRWALVARQDSGQIDGLVHLSLAPSAWRARGASLRLEDFELRMEDGTLYSTPEKVGPTALTFVGRGRVRFSPAPAAEREQLRQFSGAPSIDREVGWAFVRLHPGELHRAVEVDKLEAENAPGTRRAQAERVWRERAERSFMIDAPLPRSPWWLMPSAGDAVVDFPWGRKRVLTYALSSGEAEDVNLFDRDRRLQICTYSSGGRAPRYSEDDRRAVDVLENDITARFDPEKLEVQATHAMRARLLAPTGTLRLRLHDDFHVSSVTSEEGGSLLFFRVRDQSNLVVSLGPLAARGEPFTLTTRYSGRHDPAPVDQEIAQVSPPPTLHMADEGFVDRPPLVYSNRTAWYPRPAGEDFATARAGLDVPEGWLAVTGGELVSVRTEAGRTRAEYRLDQPGKFVTALVGRLADVGLRQEGEQAVRGYSGPRTRGETLAQMQAVQEMLAFYAEKFGPSPYPMLGLVVSEGETPGGHSPPGLVYLQRRPPVLSTRSLPDDPANFSDLPGFFLAHETAHQWWGQGTAPANYRERWLSEAWAQYAAALWLRERVGEGAFRSMMDRMARWALRHDDAGPIHLGQRLGHLKEDPRVFRAIVYDKGAWVLHMLRGLVGDQAFFAGARAFLERHRYAKAGTEDLRAALEEASGRDLRPYFESWIYATGLPTLVWSSRTDRLAGGIRTTVEVRPQGLPGPLPLHLELTWSGGHEVLSVLLDAAGGSWTIDTAQEPRRVTLNEDRGLLARIRHGSFPSPPSPARE
ncbi:MAG TPA: M1 family aminopeptidase [Vicinamibacteria bacterium]|nr:M1 family aminopeptidase [Vicinamibacteria bacterium]